MYETQHDEVEVEVDVVEVNVKKPFMCKELTKADLKSTTREPKSYTFELKKGDAIFDQLLAERLIKLPTGHKIPKAEDLKGKTLYKYHSILLIIA